MRRKETSKSGYVVPSSCVVLSPDVRDAQWISPRKVSTRSMISTMVRGEFGLDMPVLHEMSVGSTLITEAGTEVMNSLVGMSSSFKMDDRTLRGIQGARMLHMTKTNGSGRIVE